MELESSEVEGIGMREFLKAADVKGRRGRAEQLSKAQQHASDWKNVCLRQNNDGSRSDIGARLDLQGRKDRQPCESETLRREGKQIGSAMN